MFYLTNTVTGKKELFTPGHANRVLMYVCGITPYSPAHIGHGRCYVSFDIVVRLLTFMGFDVTYCRNFTDIDDKLLHKAVQELGDSRRYLEIARANIALYHHDMAALNCVAPTFEPRVTESIDIIIDFIQELINKGHAYHAGDSVYFHIPSFPSYGKLSKQKGGDMQSGARVQVRTEKKDPLDFVLWKGESDGVSWPSPWGAGRPGWHIECSAMARHYLGQELDIHAGGLDLIFPHHENEIAQSESLTGKEFARCWLHNGLVTIDQEKMAKSIGNVFLLQDVHKKCDPIVLRYFILTHHYRSPLEFSWASIQAAQKAYNRLVNTFAPVIIPDTVPKVDDNFPILQQMHQSLCDDLNTPAMFGVLFEHLATLSENYAQMVAIKYYLVHVLGLALTPLVMPIIEMTPEIDDLIAQREHARNAKNWARADQLRDQLKELGYDVQDKKVN